MFHTEFIKLGHFSTITENTRGNVSLMSDRETNSALHAFILLKVKTITYNDFR